MRAFVRTIWSAPSAISRRYTNGGSRLKPTPASTSFAATVSELHTITLRDLSDQEVARYVDAERPFDCAGSYKIEGRGIALMASIEGGDFTAITGMPLIALTTMLRTCGFRVP